MTQNSIEFLRSLPAVRERCNRVYALAQNQQLKHFEFHPEKFDEIVKFVEEIIRSRFSSLKDIPYHSRWRHFEVGNIDRKQRLEAGWLAIDWKEKVRREIDLAVVAVLLDAGAGADWSYREPSSGLVLSRSEGLGVAALSMFADGLFSSAPSSDPHRADADGLLRLEFDQFTAAFQVSGTNPLVGARGRFELLRRLGAALRDQPQLFGPPADAPASGINRPGHLLDRLLERSGGELRTSVHTLWKLLVDGLQTVWPATRTVLDGVSLGDVWPYAAAAAAGADGADGHAAAATDFVVFHKLTQWMTYSLLEPLESAGIQLDDSTALTGLAEYRNGGLLIDAGLLTPRDPALLSQSQTVDSEAVVEWRAMTVASLDEIAVRLRRSLGLTEAELPLAKVLEGGTWLAGRVKAKQLRPESGGPPIQIVSDGTVF
eukprot:TRINITY_DN31329_c0_g1_i1.p1 TRINITY_DN31329_c0_g1~~TRINITY_DN31329_c0_g1_i1.p1  ORF type:complete len:430 (+),score=155.97 TRINITY_DN31329_c0_g1_i1:190-1479(+)